jgi:PKHD-type hydroxylase
MGKLDKKKLREKGTILVFPSFVYHRVTEVTKGDRFSLVGWYEGNDWI